MELPPLQLPRDRVDVAEAALERAALEDGRGAGGVIDDVDDLLRLMDRERRGEANQHALLDGELARTADATPDLLQRGEEKAASSFASPCATCDWITAFSRTSASKIGQ